MTAVNEFENPGIEQLTNDFRELALSFVQKRDPNLDIASMERLQVSFAVMSVGIDFQREVEARRELIAVDFDNKVFPTEIEAGSGIIDGEVLGSEVEQPDLQLENGANEVDDRAAAEAVSSLVLSETVEVEEQTDETADSIQIENRESENTLLEQLTAEERFILDQLGELQPGEQVGKSFFFDRGFNSVNDRASKIAYSQAFVNAMKFLVEKGAVVKPSRQSYVLAEGYEAFLAQ
jgi:hypothetical protein